MYPSFIAQAISGFLILWILIMMLYRYNEPDSLNVHFQCYMVMLMFAVAIGVHGLQHAYSEVNFGFNPWNSQWNYQLNRQIK